MDRYAADQIIWPKVPFDLQQALVLSVRRGSESHGTYVPPTDPDAIDDRDIMGICIPPIDYYFAFKEWAHADEINGVWDVVLYEFKKFVHLLMKQNPNVVGMLWLEPEDYLYVAPEMHRLIESRRLFIARTSAFESFGGYARDQMRRMENNACEGYMGKKRKQLVERFGYDTKNAAHLVRLLNMSKEFLSTGELKVRRTWDREMIVEVKKGKWKLEEVKAYAEKMGKECEEAYKNSSLPEKPDLDAINELTTGVLRSYFARVQSI
jgi:predicted nucleotidyltransferase